jgi:hypothetical protein
MFDAIKTRPIAALKVAKKAILGEEDYKIMRSYTTALWYSLPTLCH